MKKSIKRWISLVLCAAMIMSLTAGVSAAELENIIELTDAISVNKNVASQKGAITYQTWSSGGAFSGAKANADGTFDQMKIVETKAIDWQNPITINASQFSASKKTVFNVKFKVMLDSYKNSAKPRAGIRLYQNGLMHREALPQSGGKNAFVPTEDTEKNWSVASFVIDPETNKVYSSFNGSDYVGSELLGDISGGYSGDFRMYFTAIPSTNDFADGSASLETPVTWFIDDFTAYETDTMPAPPARPEKEPEQDANISYIAKLDSNISYNSSNFTSTQEGTLYFQRGPKGTELSGYSAVGDNWDQLRVSQTLMNDWKSTFYLKGEDIKTNRKTIVDMKVKVNAEDYTVSELPQTKLRFYCNGMFYNEVSLPLTEADRDEWHTVRFVINNEDKAVYSSVDKAEYKRADYTVPDSETLGNGSQVRLYPVAVPASGDKTDGETALSTQVDWYIDTFKAYQFDGEMPSPEKDLTEDEDKIDTLLRLTDNMQYNSSNFTTSQVGYDLSMGFIKIDNTELKGAEPNGSDFRQLELVQNVMSEWKNHFNFDGAKISANKKTVIDMKFKVRLDDYNAENKPLAGWRLSSPDGLLWLDAMKAVTPDAADADKWQTLRVVLNNEDQTAYASVNGAEYVNHKFSKAVEGDTYNTQIRLYPLAIPGGDEKADGVTVLSTPVTWNIDSVIVYQTNGAMPAASDLSDPTEPDEPELPDAIPEPTAAPIPAELAGRVVRSYPDGKMKAVILSFDDGANWCADPDKRAIGILNDNGVKGTFNLVPGSAWGTFLKEAPEMYAGHEIASHGYKHRLEQDITSDEIFMEEIKKSKEVLESETGLEVPGYATPYGIRFDSKHTRMAQDLGYRYIRTALLTGKFNVPDNFYLWDPTSWLSNNKHWELIQSQMRNFREADASGEWMLMFTANHSWEFNADEDAGRTDSWFALEEFAKYVADNSDTMWNPTSIEYVDYVRASKQMKVSYADEAIVLENPTDIDVWALVDSKPVKVAAKSTTSIGAMSEREFVPEEYLLNIDKNMTQSGSTISSDGTMEYTGAIAASADGEYFSVVQDTKSVWGRYNRFPGTKGLSLDAPLVIEAKYNVSVDEKYTGASPKVQIALQAQDLSIWANNNVGTPLSDVENDSWNTIKYIIDPNTNKIYYSIDGGAYTAVSADRLANVSQLANGVMLYLKSYPSNSLDDGQDNVAKLDTPVTWTFDYVRMYKLSDKEAVKIAAAKAQGTNNIECSVDVRNYGTVTADRTLAVAVYDGTRLSDVKLVNLSLAAFAKDGLSVSFDGSWIENPTVKAFLWDSIAKMKPYEMENISID